jgi:hypothetical protein
VANTDKPMKHSSNMDVTKVAIAEVLATILVVEDM